MSRQPMPSREEQRQIVLQSDAYKSGENSLDMTQDYLKSFVIYEPNTGVFTWKPRHKKSDTQSSRCNTWNTRFANRAAGFTHDGYVFIRILGVTNAAHRLAFLYMTGEFPPDSTDHVNGVKDDNRWVNLRAVTTSQNSMNVRRYQSNKSGVSGVFWLKKNRKWSANIRVGRKLIYLGLHDNFLYMVGMRKEAEARYGFHCNHGSVIR